MRFVGLYRRGVCAEGARHTHNAGHPAKAVLMSDPSLRARRRARRLQKRTEQEQQERPNLTTSPAVDY